MEKIFGTRTAAGDSQKFGKLRMSIIGAKIKTLRTTFGIKPSSNSYGFNEGGLTDTILANQACYGPTKDNFVKIANGWYIEWVLGIIFDFVTIELDTGDKKL